MYVFNVRKLLVYFVFCCILVLVVAGFSYKLDPEDEYPALPSIPTIAVAADYPQVEEPVRLALIQALPKPAQASYREAYRVLLVGMLVSSGKFEVMNADLGSQSAIVDLLWVYDRNQAGVTQYPIAIGAQVGETYAAFFSADGITDRVSALKRAKELLPRGRTLAVNFWHKNPSVVTRTGVNWQKCAEPICLLGEMISQEHPGVEKEFALRLLTEVPTGWFLTWYSAPATAANTDPAYLDVALP